MAGLQPTILAMNPTQCVCQMRKKHEHVIMDVTTAQACEGITNVNDKSSLRYCWGLRVVGALTNLNV